MKDNIICSGALFYSTTTKRFLFLQRTAEKTKGLWGLVGGQARFTESAFEGLKREIDEEVGDTPAFKKVIPLELFTSNDQKFFFHTYLIAIEGEFIPKEGRIPTSIDMTTNESKQWCQFPGEEPVLLMP